MDPIISPWLIWLIQTCGALKFVLVVACIILGIALTIVAGLSAWEDFDDDERVKAKKCRNRLIIIIIPITILAITVPDSPTAKMMLASSYVTEENISKTSETAKEAIDYIFDKIEKLSSEKEDA